MPFFFVLSWGRERAPQIVCKPIKMSVSDATMKPWREEKINKYKHLKYSFLRNTQSITSDCPKVCFFHFCTWHGFANTGRLLENRSNNNSALVLQLCGGTGLMSKEKVKMLEALLLSWVQSGKHSCGATTKAIGFGTQDFINSLLTSNEPTHAISFSNPSVGVLKARPQRVYQKETTLRSRLRSLFRQWHKCIHLQCICTHYLGWSDIDESLTAFSLSLLTCMNQWSNLQ